MHTSFFLLVLLICHCGAASIARSDAWDFADDFSGSGASSEFEWHWLELPAWPWGLYVQYNS
jgi:hypothetical protein